VGRLGSRSFRVRQKSAGGLNTTWRAGIGFVDCWFSGHTMDLNASSVRIAVFVLFLTAVFLFTSYSASIVALLQSPSDSVKTVDDLVESSMSFSAQITPYSEIYFNVSERP